MIESADIVAAARSWIGVPFRHQGRSRLGVDCIGLIIVVRLALGPWPAAEKHVPRYRRRVHDDELLRSLRETCTTLERPEPGAVVLIRFPSLQVPTHVALCTGETIVHAYERQQRVLEVGYRAQWLKWTDSLWRLPGVLA